MPAGVSATSAAEKPQISSSPASACGGRGRPGRGTGAFLQSADRPLDRLGRTTGRVFGPLHPLSPRRSDR